jgi:hypothetical protein
MRINPCIVLAPFLYFRYEDSTITSLSRFTNTVSGTVFATESVTASLTVLVRVAVSVSLTVSETVSVS